MPPVFAYVLEALFLVLALVSIALFVQEAVSRLHAGPVRFRLGMASRGALAYGSNRGRGTVVYGWVRMFFVLGILGTALTVRTRGQLFTGSRLMLLIAFLLCAGTFGFPRRDAKRWLVLALGSSSLVIGAVVVAVRLLALDADDSSAYHVPPGVLLLICTGMLFTLAAAVCEESVLGTRMRERGIQMFCATTPWSRIAVEHWDARDRGFALHLSVLGPRLYGMGLEAESEIVIPVSASKRPALEAFLGAHAATAG
jgi:hypothetical protein